MSLFSYGRPAITWAISGGDAAFVGDPADLTDGQPASACRIKWRSGSPGTTDTVTLTGTLANAIPARCAALLNPALSTATLMPAGVKVTAAGKLSGAGVALGGNALTARTATHPNGGIRRPWVFPSHSIDTIIITVYNDTNISGSSATWAVANQLVDLGEIWVGKGADYAVKGDMKVPLLGGLLQRKTHSNQNWALTLAAYKSQGMNIVPMTEQDVIGPKSTQDDFETVQMALNTSKTSVVIPMYLNRGTANGHNPPAVIDSTTINEQRLVRSLMIGCPDSPVEYDGSDESFYTASILFGDQAA